MAGSLQQATAVTVPLELIASVSDKSLQQSIDAVEFARVAAAAQGQEPSSRIALINAQFQNDEAFRQFRELPSVQQRTLDDAGERHLASVGIHLPEPGPASAFIATAALAAFVLLRRAAR